MFSVDWLCFEKIISLMETEFNGYMTYEEAVLHAELPRHYKGDRYFPEFLKHKVIVMIPKGKNKQLYILRKDR
jgi:hypothetical protein